jgi:hypothetical protein
MLNSERTAIHSNKDAIRFCRKLSVRNALISRKFVRIHNWTLARNLHLDHLEQGRLKGRAESTRVGRPANLLLPQPDRTRMASATCLLAGQHFTRKVAPPRGRRRQGRVPLSFTVAFIHSSRSRDFRLVQCQSDPGLVYFRDVNQQDPNNHHSFNKKASQFI